MLRSIPLDDLMPGDRIGVFTGPADPTQGNLLQSYYRGRFESIERHGCKYWLFLRLDSGEPVPAGFCTRNIRHIERLRRSQEAKR